MFEQFLLLNNFQIWTFLYLNIFMFEHFLFEHFLFETFYVWTFFFNFVQFSEIAKI
jgi:hypothetical protein